MSSCNNYGPAPGSTGPYSPRPDEPCQPLESGILRGIESELEDTNTALAEIDLLLERLRRKVYGVTPALGEAGGSTATAKPVASLQTIGDKAIQAGSRARNLRTELLNIVNDL